MYLNRSRQIKLVRATAAVATTLLLLAVTLSSCTKEPAGGEQSLPDGAVRIVLSVGNTKSDSNSDTKSDSQNNSKSDPQTRVPELGSAAENRISNIKVLFYDHVAQTLDLIKHIDDVTTPSGDPTISWEQNKLIIKGVTNQKKAYDIYVVANWTEGFNASDFAKGSSIANLTEAFTKISGQIVAPDATHALLMSGSAPNHIFSANRTAQVALMRQVAKLRIAIKIDADFKAAYPNALFGAAASQDHSQLTVYNIPNSSYVYGTTDESRYNALMAKEGSELLDYPTITLTPAKTETLYATETLYVYENITLGTTPEAKEKATFMVLRLPFKLTSTATVVTENYYKFHVQDNDDRTDPHKTKRNHIYDLTATVVGFGGPRPDDGRDAYVTTTVLPWNVVDLPDKELGEKSLFDKMTTADGTFSLANGGYVVWKGETIKVYCKPNIGEWQAVTYDQTGLLVHTSTIAKDVYVNVELPERASATYTIKLYHTTAAIRSDEAEPFETLTIRQADGVIPNSVLVKPVIGFINGSKIELPGWPVEKLPPHGLQLSQIGNKLPNDEQHSENEITGAVWSTVQAVTGTATSYGSGKSNAEKLKNATGYPAANLCSKLDGEWYIPSLYEFMSIYMAFNSSLVGGYYGFYPVGYRYWTSSEINADNAYYFTFANGYAFDATKAHESMSVRCVKNI